ncbi:hypothetical protein B0J11DRAFT_258262 [Dendryphion nanum]|uniref:Uncharacterized protein n=1 Tax=Dendryphion nanum TaxID=256645 RepID=A0A9P9IRL9_9PLEO|nr:hypothetical protein B0J11DRAFT_258262 [Dendryphion nanum]
MMKFYHCLVLSWLACISDAQKQTLTTVASQNSPTSGTSIVPSPLPTTPPPLLPPATTNNSLFQCWTSWNDAAVEWGWADKNRTPRIIPYTTSISTYISWDQSAPFTTLCDKIPRALNPPVKTKTLYTTITDFKASETRYEMPPRSHPDVDCGFCDRCADCNSLSQFIAYSKSLWSQQPEPRTPATLSLLLPCVAGTPTPFGPTTPLTFPTALHSPSCLIIPPSEPDATLFFWPVTTTSGDFCLQNGKTIAPTPTIPGQANTAVYNNLTLTSPTAVLIIPTLTAHLQYTSNRRSTYWTSFGAAHTSASFSLHPSAISSVDHGGNRLRVGSPLTSYSFNFADLNTVPYEKYSSVICGHSEYGNCERIWQAYRPKIGLDREGMGRLRKEWEFCEGWGSVRPVTVPVTAGVTTSVVVAVVAEATGLAREESLDRR